MQPVDDFKEDWSDSRWVGHPGGAWGAVPMSAHRRDSAPFIPQGGPGNPLGVRVATPGIGIPSRTEPITNDENDDISEVTVSDDEGEEELLDDGIVLYDNQLFGTVEQYLGELIESVNKDNRQADELNQVPGPTLEEEPRPVPVLDPVTAGVMNAAARGDHASAVALLQDRKTSKKKKAEEEAEKNELYRLKLLKGPRWQPGAKIGAHREEPFRIRAAKGPLNTNAQGVKWVQPPKPRNNGPIHPSYA